MKSARELFEELGYEQRVNNDEQIYYYLKKETYTRGIEFRKFAKDFCINGKEWLPNDSNEWHTMSENNLFRDEFDKYCCKYGHWVSNHFNYIDAKLLQAINQQVNELGWNKEEK